MPSPKSPALALVGLAFAGAACAPPIEFTTVEQMVRDWEDSHQRTRGMVLLGITDFEYCRADKDWVAPLDCGGDSSPSLTLFNATVQGSWNDDVDQGDEIVVATDLGAGCSRCQAVAFGDAVPGDAGPFGECGSESRFVGMFALSVDAVDTATRRAALERFLEEVDDLPTQRSARSPDEMLEWLQCRSR